MLKSINIACFSLLLISTSGQVFADKLVRELGREEGEPNPYIFPYGFSSESMGLVVGVAGGISGLPQQQSSLFTTAWSLY